jgi:hypothetical protein
MKATITRNGSVEQTLIQKERDAIHALRGATIKTIENDDGEMIITTTDGLRFEFLSDVFHHIHVWQLEEK